MLILLLTFDLCLFIHSRMYNPPSSNLIYSELTRLSSGKSSNTIDSLVYSRGLQVGLYSSAVSPSLSTREIITRKDTVCIYKWLDFRTGVKKIALNIQCCV